LFADRFQDNIQVVTQLAAGRLLQAAGGDFLILFIPNFLTGLFHSCSLLGPLSKEICSGRLAQGFIPTCELCENVNDMLRAISQKRVATEEKERGLALQRNYLEAARREIVIKIDFMPVFRGNYPK